MIGFSDAQLFAIQKSAESLPVEKRSVYLERIIGFLEGRRGGLFADADVQTAIAAALKGLVHDTAA
jgi:hypothetical protein